MMRAAQRYCRSLLGAGLLLLVTGCQQRVATVVLTNGESFTGHLKEQTVTIATEYGTFSFPWSRITSMSFGKPTAGVPDQDMLSANNRGTYGDTLFRGDIREEDLDFSLELLSGQKIQFDADKVKSVSHSHH